MQTRIYLPLTVAALRHLSRIGAIEPAPLTAHAVTTDLRREHGAADDEELEYLAFLDAARSTAAGGVRVVAAADVDDETLAEVLADDESLSGVRVSAPVPRRRIASLHVALDQPGDTGKAPDLLWYDATELDVVIDLLT